MLLTLLAYVLLQLAIGFWASRKVKTESDYLLAGRSLGLGLASMSLFATWFGAETVMGSAAAIARDGLSGGRADPFGYTACLLLMGLLLAKKMREGGYTTLGDFFRERYGARVEKLAVCLMIPTSLFWAAAQLLAFGLVLHAVAGIALHTALLGAACFITCYTLMGGLLADVYTDLIQGSVVAIGLGILTFVLVQQAGGVAEAWQGIAPARLRFMAAGEGWLERLDGWAIPILGSLVAQEALSRILATRDTRIAARACYVAGGIYFVIGMMPVIAGLIGFQVWPKAAAGDHYILELAEATLSPVLYVIFAGALLSAILSTIDSTLLSVSAMVERNLLGGITQVGARPHPPRYAPRLARIRILINLVSTPLWLARECVLGSGIITYLLASGTEQIYTLLEQASSFGSAGILVTTLAGLYCRKGGALTATLTLIIGAALMLLGEQLGWPAPYLTAVAGSFLCYILAFSAEKSLLFVKLFPNRRA